jgi:hypothetical protein
MVPTDVMVLQLRLTVLPVFPAAKTLTGRVSQHGAGTKCCRDAAVVSGPSAGEAAAASIRPRSLHNKRAWPGTGFSQPSGIGRNRSRGELQGHELTLNIGLNGSQNPPTPISPDSSARKDSVPELGRCVLRRTSRRNKLPLVTNLSAGQGNQRDVVWVTARMARNLAMHGISDVRTAVAVYQSV